MMHSIRLLAFIFAIYTTVCHGNDIELNIENPAPPDLYGQFKQYRHLLKNDEDANASTFFSKKINEEWLGWLVKTRPPEVRLEVLDMVRNRMRFGDRIDIVYEKSTQRISENSAKLILVCSSTTEKRPRTIEITYVNAGNQWLIDKVLSDTTRPGDKDMPHVIDRFE